MEELYIKSDGSAALRRITSLKVHGWVAAWHGRYRKPGQTTRLERASAGKEGKTVE